MIQIDKDIFVNPKYVVSIIKQDKYNSVEITMTTGIKYTIRTNNPYNIIRKIKEEKQNSFLNNLLKKFKRRKNERNKDYRNEK